ncbi:MAG: hypothetical protein WBX15_15950 [Thermoanaerobaculia bacterium]
MSAGAWTMLGITWAIVFFFTGRFFFKVLTTPTKEEDSSQE